MQASAIKQNFLSQFDEQRKAVAAVTNPAAADQARDAAAQALDEQFLILNSNSGHRAVTDHLAADDTVYRNALKSRLDSLDKKVQILREAMVRVGNDLKKMGGSQSAGFHASGKELIKQEKLFRSFSSKLTHHLRQAVRRARIQKLLYDSLHVLAALAVFAFGFGYLGDTACQAPRLIGFAPLTDMPCQLLGVLVTLALFIAERWILGPPLDRFLENRLHHAALAALFHYYTQRVSLEYSLERLTADLDHELTRLRQAQIVS